MTSSDRAVFIDKDGTLIRDMPYNMDTKKIRFYKTVFKGLQVLMKNDYKLIIVSNQPGPAHGRYSINDIKTNRDYIFGYMKNHRINFSDFYYCPHDPSGTVKKFSFNCACRKPKPKLLKLAGERHKIDLSKSWMIGDILNDVEAGNRAGCRTILVDNGNETEWKLSPSRIPEAIVKNFIQAANFIAKFGGKNDTAMA